MRSLSCHYESRDVLSVGARFRRRVARSVARSTALSSGYYYCLFQLCQLAFRSKCGGPLFFLLLGSAVSSGVA